MYIQQNFLFPFQVLNCQKKKIKSFSKTRNYDCKNLGNLLRKKKKRKKKCISILTESTNPLMQCVHDKKLFSTY